MYRYFQGKEILSRHIFIAVILLALMPPLFCSHVYAKDYSLDPSEKPYQLIAPAFGMMIANQLFAEQKDFYLPDGAFHHSESKITIFFHTGDDGTVAHDFLFAVEQYAVKSKTWRKFQGKIQVKDILFSKEKLEMAQIKNKT